MSHIRINTFLFVVMFVVITGLLSVAGGSLAQAQESLDNLPLPRWASIAAKEVNLRTGPGKRYPIEWVLKKRGLPLEITREFEHWRMVREPDGATGWVHRSMLTGNRHVLVESDEKTLHTNPSEQSGVVARLRKGVVARVRNCQKQWCRVTIEDYTGWLTKDNLWGVYAAETLE